MKTLVFDTYKREFWFKQISEFIESVNSDDDKELGIKFKDITIDQLTPELLTSLACMIEHFFRIGFASIMLEKSKVGNYLYETLKFKEYWSSKKRSIKSDDNKFSLWKINDAKKDFYAKELTTYMQEVFYKKKDLSPLESSILESFYNAIDHANADGNIFSFVQHDEDAQRIKFAICDFGDGIAHTIRNHFSYIESDTEALEEAIKINITIKSKEYNGGMGLDNIRSSCTENDQMTIISNKAFLIATIDKIKSKELDYHFKGTMLSFSIDLSKYEDIEIADNAIFSFGG